MVDLAFITVALSQNILGLEPLSAWVSNINLFIPKVIGAAIIMVVGYVLAEFIRGQMKKTGKVFASIVAKILFFFILYVSVALALPILLGPENALLVGQILLVIIASVGLGVAIALGLGLKDAVAEISKKYVKKMKI